MTVASVPEIGASRKRRIRTAGALMIALWAAVIALQPAWNARLSSAGFDAYQLLSPREAVSMPATVVAIDERSLRALGRWPWPRTRIAQLIEAIAKHGPAAIGVDIFMPEPDPLSPERVLAPTAKDSKTPLPPWEGLPTNDSVLARALRTAPAVLAVAGTPTPTDLPLRVAPFSVQGPPDRSNPDAPPTPAVQRFAGALSSLEELNRAALGWGLVSVAPEHGVIRRIPLVASVEGTLVPAFSVEILRVAYRAPSLRLNASGRDATSIALGPLVLPTEPDGAARLHFAPSSAQRFVSAIDVLEGRVDRERLQRLVIVGVTALGLGESHVTPLGESVPGSEVHAQLLESAVDGTLLVRPGSARWLEVVAFAALGALLGWAVPAWQPRNATLLAAGCVALVLGAAYAAFLTQRIVLDAATPALGLVLLFGVLLLLTLAEAMRQQRLLERLVHAQRERNARIEGELAAARRIQLATLPSANLLVGDPRIDLAASMTPALEVGGDLYDFFRLDARRLFFIVGDVAGKGVSASIFMAVSKALYKSTMLRAANADLGAIMSEANAEVSRDNPEMMFVTAFAAILDLDTGTLDCCNAGHENPLRLHASDAAPAVIDEGGGPPLCTVDRFDYRAARHQLRRGELLCLFSDGVTDMENAAGAMYGRQRVRDVLAGLQGKEPTASAIVEHLLADVDAFAAGAARGDDVTLLVLRWTGPAPIASTSR